MRNSIVNVGVTGLGVGLSCLETFKRMSNVRVLAICDLDRDKLESVSKTYNIPHAFTDYKKLLSVKEIDAVSIHLPNYLHCPVTLDALRKGKHVLVDKPMAMNTREAERMDKEARFSKRCLMVKMNFRYMHEMLFLKKLIQKGEFGKVYCLKAKYMRRITFEDKKVIRGALRGRAWFAEKEKSGGGALIDIGVHMLDLALWLADNFNVVAVDAATYNNFGHRNVDDHAVAFIRLKDNTIVNLDVSWESFTQDEISIEVFGTKAGAKTNPLKIYSWLGGKPSIIEAKVSEETNFPYGSLGIFVNRILNKKEYLTSAREGISVMKVLDAIYESSQLKKEIFVTYKS